VHRHRRPNLQSTDRTAPSAPDRERQSARSLAGGDHLGERQHGPATTPRTVRGQSVCVFEEARDGAAINHWATAAPGSAQ